eukprot:6460513-Amphidinium_carterae.1
MKCAKTAGISVLTLARLCKQCSDHKVEGPKCRTRDAWPMLSVFEARTDHGKTFKTTPYSPLSCLELSTS